MAVMPPGQIRIIPICRHAYLGVSVAKVKRSGNILLFGFILLVYCYVSTFGLPLYQQIQVENISGEFFVSKELLKAFREAKVRLTHRYEGAIHKTISFSYTAGEGIYAAVPMVKSGFLSSVAKFDPDWKLLSSAYMNRPVPVLASAICIVASCYIAKGKLSIGYGIGGVGNGVMAADMLYSGEPASALVSIPSIVGCAKLAAHEYLYKRFGKHGKPYLRHTLGRPMLLGGALLAYSYVPLIGASIAEGSYAATASAAGWSTGALLTMLLQGRSEKKVEAEAWKLEHADDLPARASRRRKNIKRWAGPGQAQHKHRYRQACTLRK